MKAYRVVTLRSMPGHYVDAIDARAGEAGSKAAIYSLAFDALSSSIEAGERIRSFPSRGATCRQLVKLPREVVDRADRAIVLNGPPAKKSRFAAEAVRRYLDSVDSAPGD